MCTVLFDGWTLHSDNECIVCVCMGGIVQRERDQIIKLHGRPPETPISNLVQHIEMVAPPPLVPFTEEPLSLVGNPASWVSLMCPLCLEILNSPVELVTCGSIVCYMLLCLA